MQRNLLVQFLGGGKVEILFRYPTFIFTFYIQVASPNGLAIFFVIKKYFLIILEKWVLFMIKLIPIFYMM